MTMHPRSCLCCITPPHILRKLLESKDKEIRDAALNTMLATAQLRGEREVRAAAGFLASPSGGRRTIFDLRNSTFLPTAVVARTETGPASADVVVNRAFVGLGTTRDFYKTVLNRDSLDGRGMRLDAYVHRGVRYNNAFWDGQQMVFGDGDGLVFTDFTRSLDVIAHELSHGVTEFTANLEYHKEPGALNESMSDVFGSLVKQWALGQSAAQADWLIGSEIMTPGIDADALRSLKAPGTAYDNDLLGRDPQPDHMDRFVQLPDTMEGDWGGVHINSGIPNKAFYLVATGLGGNAWETPGQIWFDSLRASTAQTKFQEFADTTYQKAERFGTDVQEIVAEAWREVGIRVTGVSVGARRRRCPPADDLGNNRGGNGSTQDHSGLAARLDALATEVQRLAREVNALQPR